MSKKTKNTPVAQSAAGESKEVIAPGVLEAPVVIESTVVNETNTVLETPVVTQSPVVNETSIETQSPVVNETSTVLETHEATVIPSGKFISENGEEYEFTVNSFSYQGNTYTKEEALSDHNDVLEHLASIKSFILKKV